MVFVIDTSVFLSDPKAFERLSKLDIVIPFVVIEEMESKRSHPELGYAARENLRFLESLRLQNGLMKKTQTREGGSIQIELNHIDESTLPSSFLFQTNDNRILAVAFNLQQEGPVTLITKDLPLRIKASVVGLTAQDYDDRTVESEWSGVISAEVDRHLIDDIYANGFVEFTTDDPVNTSYILRDGSHSALARYDGKNLNLVRDTGIFDVKGRSAEQRLAIDLLKDDDIKIASIGGKAGTGKSVLALAAGLESVIEENSKKRVIVFRPLYTVGGQDLGFLPGDQQEKMHPWTLAVFDALESFCGPNVIDTVIEDDLLEVLPLSHIRGRTISDSYIIIDEAQNLEKHVLLTALSRVGDNTKIVLTHDVAQRDNLRVGRHDGVNSVISALAGSPLFAHISLRKSERSEVAELVSTLLD